MNSSERRALKRQRLRQFPIGSRAGCKVVWMGGWCEGVIERHKEHSALINFDVLPKPAPTGWSCRDWRNFDELEAR